MDEGGRALTDETEKSTSNVWQRIKASLGLQYGMPFIDGPDEPEETQLEFFPPPFPMPPFPDLSTAEHAFDIGIDLSGIHVLPQSTLEQLVLEGKLMSVTTFDEHMHPDVHWIAPAEFGAAFDELTKAEKPPMTEAAYTELKPAYPAYLNLQLATQPTASDPLGQRAEYDTVIVTARGAPITGKNADGLDTITCAPTAVLQMTMEAWDQLNTQFTRLRAGGPYDKAEPTGFNTDQSAIDAEADKYFGKDDHLQGLASRFCAAPLPDDVAADLCATIPGSGRHGTNLLTVTQATEVLRYVLATPE